MGKYKTMVTILLLHIVVNLFSMRGECHYHLDQFQQALQDFDSARALNPKDGRKSFVQWLYENKNYKDVITSLGIMLHDNPSDLESLWYIIKE